jgi:hypothetical protein
VVLGKGVIGGGDSGKKLKDALADIIEYDKKKKEKKKIEVELQLPPVVPEKPKKQGEPCLHFIMFLYLKLLIIMFEIFFLFLFSSALYFS